MYPGILNIYFVIRLTKHRTIRFANIDPQSFNRPTSAAEEIIYNVAIHGLAYKISLSQPKYTLAPSSSSAHSQYTVVEHGPSNYTVHKHISSSPTGTVTFSVKMIRGRCMIRREYGSVKAYYSVTKQGEDIVLGCWDGSVLENVGGYTMERLEGDAFAAFDVGLFVSKLEAMGEEEWVMV
jgi:hypothetical protein